MKFSYITSGVCSRVIHIEIDEDKILDVTFEGGCNGNLKGIGALVQGMDIQDAIDRLEGIRCGFKSTSCPDQLARALKEYKAQN